MNIKCLKCVYSFASIEDIITYPMSIVISRNEFT